MSSAEVLNIQRPAEFICASVVFTALAACGDWPPHGEDLRQYVRERKPEIESLISEFEASDFGRIECRFCLASNPVTDWDSVSYKFIDGQLHDVENPRSHDFAVMFKEAGVMYVSGRSGGELDLGIAASANNKHRSYTVQLFHDPDHNYGTLKECVTDFERIDCGACKISIDDSLLIRYQWYPTDIDPELTQARASGEISLDEWQERSRAADDACMKAGLHEQGYDLDAN